MQPDLLDAKRSLSRALIGLSVAVVTVSVYLLQRAADIVVFGLQPNGAMGIDPMGLGPQAVQYGLRFSYLTMSIVWPIVLGILCAALVIVREKRDGTLAAIKQRTGNTTEVVLMDAFHFAISHPVRRRLLTIASWLPLSSILCVGAAQLFVAVILAGQRLDIGPAMNPLNSTAWVSVNGALQIAGVATGVWLTWGFGRDSQFVLAAAVAESSVIEPSNNQMEPTSLAGARPSADADHLER